MFEENSVEKEYITEPGNRIKETSDEIFNYDDNGNMTGRTRKATGDYGYDASGNMAWRSHKIDQA